MFKKFLQSLSVRKSVCLSVCITLLLLLLLIFIFFITGLEIVEGYLV